MCPDCCRLSSGQNSMEVVRVEVFGFCKECGMEGWGETLSDRSERVWYFAVAQTLTGVLTHLLVGYVVWGKLPVIFKLQLLYLICQMNLQGCYDNQER